MTDDPRVLPPTAEEIERLFRNPAVVTMRPVIHLGLKTLGLVRRFGWRSHAAASLLDLEPPLILAANHLSHADTPAILRTLPRPIRRRTAVAAALDVFGRSRNGQKLVWKKELLQLVVAAGFHAFAFDRHGPPLRSVRTSAELVRGGWNLLLYPEGTRSRDGAIAPFKAGVGVLARITGRPVVPIHVSGGDVVQPHGALMPNRGQVLVRYGRPMWPAPDERPTRFTERLHHEVMKLASAHAPAESSPVSVDQRLEPVRPAEVGEQPA